MIVVGIGARSGATADELLAAVDAVLPAPEGPVRLATLDSRAAEPGLREAAARRGWPLTGHPAATLAAVPVPAPSVRVAAAVGTASVAEAAALLEGGRLVVGKTVHGRVTVAVALDPDLRHHGDAEVGPGLVDLAVNVRADAPPPWLRTVLHEAVEASAAYPDLRPARAAVAAAHRRDPAEVLLTAGAAETFTLVARALRPRRAVVVHPSFTEPEAALRAAGHPVERLVLTAPGYQLDPAAVPADADLVVVGNPTNPTSVLHPAADLAALARPGRVLLVDEAFADTVPGEPESLTGRSDLPGLLVVRSLTKTWGLAGLRVGYALGPADLVAALAAQQPHWPVSTPALAALTACTTPAARAEAEEVAHQLTAHRAALLAALPAAVEVVADPRSSFVLLRVREGARVRERLRERGWAVRRGDTFPGLGSDHLRIAVRDPETSRAFASALAETLDPIITTEEVR
ncbi:Rv2231c family pyridoxal phosphate-dependent protein CobC [Modestobacter sp. VKM Ac-2979]|uniref:Rv2231c family pyridoxal phosphate-dependent protein CobC n=1 Tax=unclassified Modestobacter TaxID=2643866 RepID=UPI0022AB8A59|nr:MULTISPECIES: Rv2231c family pyridoxal phosphate-dependent protein CobC [unclassified Modestobacter]MCZ2813563.1 Rv2231c family pyridoxal phosphate-dependent protein CobC [Modestobacter sp. VKM Ac-2979]MCZ2842245.1 Rv2231c family pyridoxal phosphate-dependent protein CobC [Modestobacter sp. VKM Ac-2980]